MPITDSGTEQFYAALWVGALLMAAGVAIDAFPSDLDDLAEQFFEQYRPSAKA